MRLERPCRRCARREAMIDGLCGPCIDAEAPPQPPKGWHNEFGAWRYYGESTAQPPRRELSEMTKADWLAEIRADKEQGGSGSKQRVADRLHYSIPTVRRYWRKVSEGDDWPSG